MATYYVDYASGNDNTGNGSSGNPWKTPNKALTVVSSGDTVKLRGSKTNSASYYRAQLQVDVNNTTWEADTGHTPTFDGGYTYTYGNAASYGLGNSVPGSLYGKMISIRANNVTFRRLRVQNVGGGGIGVGGTSQDALIEYCEVDTCYGANLDVGGVNQNSPTNGLEVRYCTFLNSSFSLNDPNGPENANGGQVAANAVMLKFANNVHFHHNTLAYSFKEGINIDKTSRGTIVEWNVIHSINHSHIYINRSVDIHVRYNVLYHGKRKEFLGNSWNKQTAPAMIKVGDEGQPGKPADEYGNSSKQRIYGNLVIGGSSCFTVANNDSNYDTTLNEAYIGYNSFIGEVWDDGRPQPSKTKTVVEIFGNRHSKPHQKTIFENNLIYAPSGVVLAKGENVGGITFRNNCWYSANGTAAPTAFRSASDITADPKLTNPDVDFVDRWPNADGGVNLNNYKLLFNSPCIGRASDRSATNSVTPPTITIDLAGATRTDFDRPNMRFFDIGAFEYSAGGGGTGTVTANFTQSATAGTAPLTVTFTNTSGTTGAASINVYQWDFGDGNTSTSAASSVQHTYTVAGSYRPKLTVQDTGLGLTNVKNGSWITVTAAVSDTITANFTQSATSGTAPLTVTFTNTTTDTGNAVANSYTWEFGDGETLVSSAETVQHTYAGAGTFTPTLTARDSILAISDTHTGSAITVAADPTVDEVRANFTQSGTGGQAPYIVTFTDTSTAEGDAVIDEFEWRFGDGVTSTTASSPFPYIYSSPGTYTPRLIVRDTTLGLQDAKNGSAITVTAPPEGNRPGIFDVVRTTMPTTTGDKTITFNLNGLAPAVVLLFMTKATAVSSAVDDAMMSYGATDGVKQWCYAFDSDDGDDPSDTVKYATESACVVSLDAGAVTGTAVVKNFGADKVVLTVTDAFPSGYLLHAVAITGSNFHGAVGGFELGVQNQTTTITTPWQPEVWLFGGNVARALDAIEDNADFTIGFAATTAAESGSFAWRDIDNETTTRVKAGMGTNPACIRTPINNAYAYLDDATTGRFKVAIADIGRRFGYAALDIPSATSFKVSTFQTPTATGNQSYSLGFQPSGALIVFSLLEQLNANFTSTLAEGFAVAAVDAYATYCMSIASDHNAGATNSRSLVSDSIVVVDGTGTTILAGALTFDADGFDINWTTVAATAKQFMVFAISGTPSVTGPICDFTADDTTPRTGTVQFTDLSDPNGSPITAWGWSFGDGQTSTEQNPEHTYVEPGLYTVVLAVQNANGIETRTKQNYINYQVADEWMLGPYEPLDITNTSQSILHGDNPADVHYGYIEFGLNLDAIEVDAFPEDTTSPSAKLGKARIVLDRDNGQLIIIWPDGTTNTVSFD